MSKMNELSITVTELKRYGEALISISESLSEMFNTSSYAGADVKQPESETKKMNDDPLTLEAVRAVLAEKSRAGFTSQVRELLEKHGATRLSDISPTEYSALMADAEVLGNG